MTESKIKYKKLQRLDSFGQDDLLNELNYKKSKKVKRTHYQKFIENWKSGITVGLVSLPVSISLAVASGSTPSAGIMSAIVSGIVMGILGGSNYNILGPTGSLTSFLQNCCLKYGMSSLPYFAMVAGAYTFLLRMYSLEKFIDLFPIPVNEGFTLGIALVMMIGQINNIFGIGTIKKTEYIKTNDGAEATITIDELENEDKLLDKLIDNMSYLTDMKPFTFFVFLLFFISLYFLLRKYPHIPWMIISAVVGIVFGAVFQGLDTLKTKFGQLSFYLCDFSYLTSKPLYFILDIRLWIDAIPIAFVINLETLISAKIAESMTNTRFHKKRELMALSSSNFISGFLGGIPVSGALARTALNIKSGATHKYSSAISSLVMLILSVIFISLISFLPLAVVAAQVCIVAIRMVNFDSLNNMYTKDRTQFVNAALIGIICCLKDPITACVFGMLIYLALFCENLMTPWAEIIATHERDNILKDTESMTEFKEGDFNDNITVQDDDLKYRPESPNKERWQNMANSVSPKMSYNILFTKKNSSLELKKKSSDYLRFGSMRNLHDKILETLENHLCDVPITEGDYIIYRIIGIINFMNVGEHVEKLRALATKENSTLVISLRYMHFIDIDALHAIKLIVDQLKKEFKKIDSQCLSEGKGTNDHKVLISGISRSKIALIKNEEWIQKMAEQNLLIYNDKNKVNRPSLIKDV